MISVSERHDTIASPPLVAIMIHNRSSFDDPDSDELCVTSVEVEGSKVKIPGGNSVSVSVLAIDMHGLE